MEKFMYHSHPSVRKQNPMGCRKGAKDSDNQEDKVENGASQPTDLLDENGGVACIKTFEDILDIIGTSGAWNGLVFVLCCYSTFTLPMIAISYQFVGATPDHWCRVDTLIHANWTQQQVLDLAIPKRSDSKGHEQCLMYDYDYAMAVNLGYEISLANRHLLSKKQGEPIPCYVRDFNFTQYSSTLVTEWDLVCEKLSLYSTTQASSHLGLLFGAGAAGYLLDLFGRRRVILVCSLLSLICAATLTVSPDFQLYILMKTLTSTFDMGVYVGCFVLLMELCSLKQRSSIGSMFVIPYAMGFMVVPGIAYFIRPWRWLQGAYVIPFLPLLLYFWLLPESPRWLISEGRYQEALKILTWAAKVNRRELPPAEALIVSMKTLASKSEDKVNELKQSDENKGGSIASQIWRKFKHVFVLVIMSCFRKRALICFFCWFAASMVYYGVSLNSTNLSADPYLYVFLGGVTEFPAYLLLWPSIAYFGRKYSLIAFYVLCAATISIVAAIMLVYDEASVIVLMILSLTGKLGITAAFHLIYVFTAELFPTKYRSLAVGESSMMARVGSMISPYVNDILGNAISWGPSALFAVVSLLAAGLSIFLPETGRSELIETTPTKKNVEDQENGKLMKENESKE